MEDNNKIIEERLCKKCCSSNLDVKFGKNRWVCNKCCCKINNQKLKDKNYHKEYYENNKDVILQNAINYYNINVKPYIEPNKKKEDHEK